MGDRAVDQARQPRGDLSLGDTHPPGDRDPDDRPSIDIPAILRQYVAGHLPLDRLITKSYELDQLNQAFADMREGKLNRGVVVFDDQLAGLCGQDDVITLAA